MDNQPPQYLVPVNRRVRLSVISPIRKQQCREQLLKLPGIIGIQDTNDGFQIAYQLPVSSYAEINAVLADLQCLPVLTRWVRYWRWFIYFLEDNRREHLQIQIDGESRLRILYIDHYQSR